MRSLLRWRILVALALVAVVLIFAGCSPSASSDSGNPGGPGGSATATAASGGAHATATPTPPPPPHALAWFQMDSHNVGQIWASLNGGTPHQITHMAATGADCARDEHWGPPVFSPDLSKIVAAWGSADCTDGPETGDLLVINASSGATTTIPSSSNTRLSLREAGWIDNSHVWWIDGQHLHQYTIGGGASVLGTLTANFTNDAVLRGNTLFFSVGSGNNYSLKRFDMSSHTVLASSVSMGSINPCQCSRNDALTPGFDVSPDGGHIVYQKTAPASGTSGDAEGVASSQFFYANADGSGASRIASVATAGSMVKMQISPNGLLVAVARAEPTSVFTASVSGAGSVHFYTPDGRSYPVWKTDSATFWASTKDLDDVSPPGTGNMEHFDVGSGGGTSSGSVGAAGGANPWYTIGG
jgi:hypothetical protein